MALVKKSDSISCLKSKLCYISTKFRHEVDLKKKLLISLILDSKTGVKAFAKFNISTLMSLYNTHNNCLHNQSYVL